MILNPSFSSFSASPFLWLHSSPSCSHISFGLVILHLLILFLDFFVFFQCLIPLLFRRICICPFSSLPYPYFCCLPSEKN